MPCPIRDTVFSLHSNKINPRVTFYHAPRIGHDYFQKRLSEVIYRIELVSNKRKRLVVYFNRLKPCYIDQSTENQLGHKNGKRFSRIQTKRDQTSEDTGTTVMQGTPNEDTGNTDDDEVDWVVKTYPKRNTRQVTRETSPEHVWKDLGTQTLTIETLQDNPQLPVTQDTSTMSRCEIKSENTRTCEDISPTCVCMYVYI